MHTLSSVDDAPSEITEIIELEIEGVEEVLSLSNIGGGEYFADDLNESVWLDRVQELQFHPIYPNLIISSDGKTGAIFVDIADHIVGQSARSIVVQVLFDIIQSSDESMVHGTLGDYWLQLVVSKIS